MGGFQSKSGEEPSLFSKEEKDILLISFREFSSKGKCDLEHFQAFIGNGLKEEVMKRLYLNMLKFGPKEKNGDINFSMFTKVMGYILKGSLQDLCAVICSLVADSASINGDQLYQFVYGIVLNYVNTAKDKYAGWKQQSSTESCDRITKSLLRDLLSKDKDDSTDLAKVECSKEALEKWLSATPLFQQIFRALIHNIFNLTKSQESMAVNNEVLPVPRLLPADLNVDWKESPSILDIPEVLLINSHVPAELKNEWRFLFSSSQHGESFSTFIKSLLHKGPSLLVLRDKDGHVFGGFASESWETRPQFQGSSHCFLFTLIPSTEVYHTTGYNDHHMYLNLGQQTMPNGLGMGGQHDYFGLWLDSDYGSGHSKAKPKCTTFGSPQLSASEDFSIDVLEAWALGPLPKISEEDSEGMGNSVLDTENEARAILEMAGREMKSEGLRDQEPTADTPEVKDMPMVYEKSY